MDHFFLTIENYYDLLKILLCEGIGCQLETVNRFDKFKTNKAENSHNSSDIKKLQISKSAKYSDRN